MILNLILCCFLTWPSTTDVPANKAYNVYVFLHDECVISRYYTLTLNDLHQKHKDIATFIAVFPNSQVDEARLAAFKNKFDIDFDLVTDADFALTERFGATVTPEVFVEEVRTKEVVYFGRIDNAYARVGRKRPKVTRHELKDVMSDLRNKRMTTVAHQPSIGCIITKWEPETEEIEH